MPSPVVNSATADSLSTSQLYSLLRLRVDVFVVEQQCPYAELDGLDLAPGTRHYWITEPPVAGHDPAAAAATLRTLTTDGQLRIGRVATNAAHRGAGYAAALMDAALAEIGDQVVTLEAQAHLQHWYGRFGFVTAGAEYLEDDIPHVHMSRTPR